VRRLALVSIAAVVLLAAPAAVGVADVAPPDGDGLRSVMFVGNNWDGTADIIDAQTYEPLHRIDTIPDYDERMAEIASTRTSWPSSWRSASSWARATTSSPTTCSPRTTVGSCTCRGRASRTSSGSTLETEQIVWRFPMEGYRADHMGISPDGTRLLVSDSTANKVHELDPRTGEKTGEFASGDSPHENAYTSDGSTIYHASIGRVYTPTDRSELGRSGTPRRVSGGSRSWTARASRSWNSGTWGRSWRRPAIPT
jgi:hypothetical protein